MTPRALDLHALRYHVGLVERSGGHQQFLIHPTCPEQVCYSAMGLSRDMVSRVMLLYFPEAFWPKQGLGYACFSFPPRGLGRCQGSGQGEGVALVGTLCFAPDPPPEPGEHNSPVPGGGSGTTCSWRLVRAVAVPLAAATRPHTLGIGFPTAVSPPAFAAE